MSIQSFKCPNCGGNANQNSRACEYCGSALATTRCPSCFRSIFAGTQVCPFCGDKSRREEETHNEIDCPQCLTQLSLAKVGETVLHECGQCGGLWVNREALEKICEKREEQERVLELGDKPEISVAKKKVAYLPCPECKNLMNRMNFARFSGVIVDWCKQHGTWFEQKELTQLVHFIREGGMKRSREREKESLREEASRLRQKSFEIEAERRNSYTLSPEESDDFSQLFTALKSLIKSD